MTANVWRCAICLRKTDKPAAFVGADAIGPKCAKRLGFSSLKPRLGSRLVLFSRIKAKPSGPGTTLDLFEQEAA